MSKQKTTLLIALAYFAICVIWGSTYLWNKIAVTELSPFMLAGFRFTLAGILTFIFARFMGVSIQITLKQFWNTLIAGVLFLTVGNGIVVWALKYVDSGFAALEISAQPLVVLLMMRILYGEKIKPMSIIGIILGTIGIYLLVGQDSFISQEGSILGMVMIFVCMISWGYGSLFVAKADLPQNAFVNTGYQMVAGGVCLMVVSLIIGEQWTHPGDWSFDVLWAMILLVLFGSIAAFTSFNYLLKKISAEKVASSAYINPIIALALGWYYLDEVISLQSIVAAVVLLTGVYFINTKK